MLAHSHTHTLKHPPFDALWCTISLTQESGSGQLINLLGIQSVCSVCRLPVYLPLWSPPLLTQTQSPPWERELVTGEQTLWEQSSTTRVKVKSCSFIPAALRHDSREEQRWEDVIEVVCKCVFVPECSGTGPWAIWHRVAQNLFFSFFSFYFFGGKMFYLKITRFSTNYTRLSGLTHFTSVTQALFAVRSDSAPLSSHHVPFCPIYPEPSRLVLEILSNMKTSLWGKKGWGTPAVMDYF